MATLTPDIAGTEGTAISGGNSLPSSAIGEFQIGVSPIGEAPLPPGTPGLPDIIPSYVYWQYSDDDNIQAFVAAWNQIAQYYLDWFNSIGLPVYTGIPISGALLDWVTQGLYGLIRPTLPSGTTQIIGPLGTGVLGEGPPLGTSVFIGPSQYYVTNDDIFKRILTWHFFKGDGRVFNIEWLKRRIMRFLIGSDGAAPDIDETYRISVTFGTGNQVNLTIVNEISNFVGGTLGRCLPLGMGLPLGEINVTTMQLTPLPFAQTLADAIDFGALELPFQFDWVVNV